MYKCIVRFIMALFCTVFCAPLNCGYFPFHLCPLIFWQTNSQMVQCAALEQTGRRNTNCYKFQVVLNDRGVSKGLTNAVQIRFMTAWMCVCSNHLLETEMEPLWLSTEVHLEVWVQCFLLICENLIVCSAPNTIKPGINSHFLNLHWWLQTVLKLYSACSALRVKA